MKKKFLSTLLLSAVLVTSSVQAFASTPQHNLVQAPTNLSNNIVNSNNKPISITENDNVITKTYSNNSPIQSESYNKDSNIIYFYHNGKQYSVDVNNDYVGYNKPNKYAAVLYAQTKFNFLISSGLAEDGKYGPATHGATEKYQQSRRLPVDCIIGPNTWNYLFNNI